MTDFFSPPPRVLAHRGDSLHYPENTEASFRSALEKGADVLETDLHISADGRAVLSHDPDFHRLGGDPRPISSLTFEDIKKIDLGRLFRPEKDFPCRGKGLRPLLLEEALELFPGARFNLDLKSLDPRLPRETARVIRARSAESRVCVGSFFHRPLRSFRRLLPETASSFSRREIYSIIIFHRLGWSPASCRRGNARVLQIPEYSGSRRLLTPSLFRWCRKRDLRIQVWTVNDPDKIKALLAEGVEGVFSDDPGLLAEICRL